jgi:hypothetical protein
VNQSRALAADQWWPGSGYRIKGERLSSYPVEIQRRYGEDYRAASILRTLLTRPLIANGAANLGRSEPEFARVLAKAVLSRSAKQVLCPSTFLKSSLYWAPRAMLQRLALQTGKKTPRA